MVLLKGTFCSLMTNCCEAGRYCRLSSWSLETVTRERACKELRVSEYAIEMMGITKTFPGVIANDKVNLQVREKEIHALLGENGAGKSTLMSILFGAYSADSGTISIHGKQIEIKNPNIALSWGLEWCTNISSWCRTIRLRRILSLVWNPPKWVGSSTGYSWQACRRDKQQVWPRCGPFLHH